jgi:hypothetical protein
MKVEYCWYSKTDNPDEVVGVTLDSKNVPCIGEIVVISVRLGLQGKICKEGKVINKKCYIGDKEKIKIFLS